MTQVSEKQRADYTEGSITGSILKMGLPSMFGFLTQNIYNLVDMWWVSRLPDGENAVAAVTFFGVILMLLFSFNQLVGPGSVAVISRRYGEKDDVQVEKAIKETIILKLFFGLIFGIAGFLLSRQLLTLVGARGTSLEQGVEYAQIMFLALAVPYAMYSIFTALRGVANPNMAMSLMLGSNILNMVLDPVFIFGYFGVPAMGIRGAAVASVISFILTLIVGLAIFYTGRANVRLHLRGEASMSVHSMLTLLKIGLPAWLGSLSFSGSRLLITPMIATYGNAVVAAFGVGGQVLSFGIMVIVGIGIGLSSLIGHNVGAGKIDRALKTGNRAIELSLGIMIFFGCIVFLFAESFVGMFFETPETIGYGVSILRIFAVAFPAIGVYIMIEEIHMGVGLNAPMMVFSMINGWGLRVLPVFVVTTFWNTGPDVIWWILSLSLIVTAAAVYVYYRRGRWLTVKV